MGNEKWAGHKRRNHNLVVCCYIKLQIKFPAAFGPNGVVGLVATEDIPQLTVLTLVSLASDWSF